MKLSYLTEADVCEYLRIDAEEQDVLLHDIMDAAKSYILSYTGLTKEQADEHDDLVMAFLLLCQDMYDNTGSSAVNIRRRWGRDMIFLLKRSPAQMVWTSASRKRKVPGRSGRPNRVPVSEAVT